MIINDHSISTSMHHCQVCHTCHELVLPHIVLHMLQILFETIRLHLHSTRLAEVCNGQPKVQENRSSQQRHQGCQHNLNSNPPGIAIMPCLHSHYPHKVGKGSHQQRQLSPCSAPEQQLPPAVKALRACMAARHRIRRICTAAARPLAPKSYTSISCSKLQHVMAFRPVCKLLMTR